MVVPKLDRSGAILCRITCQSEPAQCHPRLMSYVVLTEVNPPSIRGSNFTFRSYFRSLLMSDWVSDFDFLLSACVISSVHGQGYVSVSMWFNCPFRVIVASQTILLCQPQCSETGLLINVTPSHSSKIKHHLSRHLVNYYSLIVKSVSLSCHQSMKQVVQVYVFRSSLNPLSGLDFYLCIKAFHGQLGYPCV